jgi:hypothetical protein
VIHCRTRQNSKTHKQRTLQVALPGIARVPDKLRRLNRTLGTSAKGSKQMKEVGRFRCLGGKTRRNLGL